MIPSCGVPSHFTYKLLTFKLLFFSHLFLKISHYRILLWPSLRTKRHERAQCLQQPSFFPNNGVQLLRCSYYADRRVNLSTQMLTLLARLLGCLRGNNVARTAQSQLAKKRDNDENNHDDGDNNDNYVGNGNDWGWQHLKTVSTLSFKYHGFLFVVTNDPSFVQHTHVFWMICFLISQFVVFFVAVAILLILKIRVGLVHHHKYLKQ